MSAGKEGVRIVNVSVSSGTGNANITRAWELSRRFRLVPPNETDSYDVSVLDADSHLIFKRSGQVGTLSELQFFSLGIASSVSVANASTDGTYTAKFDLH